MADVGRCAEAWQVTQAAAQACACRSLSAALTGLLHAAGNSAQASAALTERRNGTPGMVGDPSVYVRMQRI